MTVVHNSDNRYNRHNRYNRQPVMLVVRLCELSVVADHKAATTDNHAPALLHSYPQQAKSARVQGCMNMYPPSWCSLGCTLAEGGVPWRY